MYKYSTCYICSIHIIHITIVHYLHCILWFSVEFPRLWSIASYFWIRRVLFDCILVGMSGSLFVASGLSEASKTAYTSCSGCSRKSHYEDPQEQCLRLGLGTYGLIYLFHRPHIHVCCRVLGWGCHRYCLLIKRNILGTNAQTWAGWVISMELIVISHLSSQVHYSMSFSAKTRGGTLF